MTTPSTRTAFYLRLFAAVFAGLLLAIGAGQAILHLNDLSGMTHIGGIWMTLAQHVNDGVFYPPLQADGHYAGTRYMPLLFCLIAGAARVTGNYLVAAKAVTLLAMCGLVTATIAATWRITRRPLDALTLGGLLLAYPEGLRATLCPHADALALALSVAGLLVVVGTPVGIGRTALAAILFSLAFDTKFSSAAAPLAAAALLFQHERKCGFTLLLLVGGLAVVACLLFQLASNGQFGENFHALGGGGMNLDTIRIGPARLVGTLTISSAITPVVPLLVPLALLTVYQNFRARGFTVWDWYFLASILTTVVIFASPGTDSNHLLEMEVAAVLVMAQRFVPTAPTVAFADAPLTRVAVLAALVLPGYTLLTTEPDEAVTLTTLSAQLPNDPHLFTEDPTPSVLLGERPVVMDPFAFRVLAEKGLIDQGALVARIDHREFDALVMLRRVDDPDERLEKFHYGPQVNNALRRQYRFDQQVGQYYLYRPLPWWHWWAALNEETKRPESRR